MNSKLLAAVLTVAMFFTSSGYLDVHAEYVEPEENEVDPNVPTHVVAPWTIESNSIIELTSFVAEANVEVEVVDVVPQPVDKHFDILQPCGYTREELEYAVSGERHNALLPYVETMLQAEEEFGVNAFYLLCKFGYESGWGRYLAADNNIGGWKSKDGSFRDFGSIEECILHIAENLSTVYKERVGSKLKDVCARYCPDDGYLETLLEIMDERTEKIKEF